MKVAIRFLALSLLSALALLTFAPGRAQANPPPEAGPTPLASPPAPHGKQAAASEACLVCHSRPQLSMSLPDGDPLNLAIDGAALTASLHGQAELGCPDCHTTITEYPHPVLTAQNLREVTRQFSDGCQSCHADQANRQHDSVHQQALAAGDEDAATCSDCHNPHNTRAPAQPRANIVATCGKCHSTMAQDYSQSVHGVALLQEDNPDVPTCIDCHGVHNVSDPVTPRFLNSSPELCAKCHTDAAKMAKYNLNTDVLNSYVADFHGTTVTLFGKTSPDQLTNKPLCIDCHGTHDIKPVKDANSPVIKNNLLATCRQCHPNADANFPGAWLSHYAPSLQHAPLVYLAGIAYKIIIPVTIGGMLLFVAADASRRFHRPGHGARK